MVDLEPFLEAPFEQASNLSFEVLLGLGVTLWVAVAVLGRSTMTMAVVAIYLLLIPGYVGYRIRVWEGADESNADADDSGDEAADGTDTDGDNGSGDDGDG
ncbi:hypothetical protein HT576_17770 [Haloterrigena sp. SYSU A121-1]|uniref:Uncharacterized protein n=1 Tax=Haloterrigena gelatinilytica TaxID=2741724 RepID=A0A8J8GND8_9EURY|nr:hypothetical protein [Haloterrigena gelatinilytica]NUB92856.1 hypothetical protein [Haloterrigena gelatinilytica]